MRRTTLPPRHATEERIVPGWRVRRCRRRRCTSRYRPCGACWRSDAARRRNDGGPRHRTSELSASSSRRQAPARHTRHLHTTPAQCNDQHNSVMQHDNTAGQPVQLGGVLATFHGSSFLSSARNLGPTTSTLPELSLSTFERQWNCLAERSNRVRVSRVTGVRFSISLRVRIIRRTLRHTCGTPTENANLKRQLKIVPRLDTRVAGAPLR